MPRTKTQKILRYVAYGALGLGIIALLLYVFVIRTIQIHNQKQNFVKAEASLDSLEQQIETKMGKPDQIKKEKSCGYASRVYEKGPRGCSATILLLYAKRDSAFANNSLQSVSSLLGTKIYDRLGRNSVKQFTSYEGSGPDQAFSQSISNSFGLDCSLQYLYPVIPLFDKAFTNVSGENLQIELSCGGPAMAEFYPVKS